MTEICIMKKTMKSTNIRKIVVICKFEDAEKRNTYEIDGDIFDDPYMEAATRFIEDLIKSKDSQITPVIDVYDVKDVKNYDKQYVYNSYHVIINAAYHAKAEILRSAFLKMSKGVSNPTGIDLAKESVKSVKKINKK